MMRRFILIAIVILLAIAFSLPPLFESQAKKWVEAHGGEDFSVANIDFNPFTARLSLQDVFINHKGKQTLNLPYLKLKMSWQPLMQRKIIVDELSISGLSVDIANHNSDSANIGGILLQSLTATEENITDTQSTKWQLIIKYFELQNAKITYSEPTINTHLEIDSFTLDDFDSNDNDKQASVQLDGKLNNAPVSVNGQVNPSGKQLQYDGHIKLTKLNLSQFTKHDFFNSYPINGLISIDSAIAVEFQTTALFSFKHSGDLLLSDFSTDTEEISLNSSKIHWAGENTVTRKSDEGILLTNSGKLTQDDISLTFNGKDIELALANFDWKGNIHWQNEQPTIKGQLQFNGLQSSFISDQVSIMGADSIKFSDLDIANLNEIAVADISINNLLLNQPSDKESDKKPLIRNQQLNINGVEYHHNKGIQINTILVKGLSTYLQKLDADNWSHSSFVSKLELLFSTPEPPEDTTQENFNIRINDSQLDGALLRYTDISTTPQFKSDIAIESLKLSTVSTEQPELPIHLMLNATIDESSQLIVEGDTQPFHQDTSTTLTIQLKGLPVHPLTSYSTKVIGYEINSGEMDLDSEVKIKSGLIDASNKLKFYHLKVKALGKKQLKELNTKKISSLETGLSILRDDNNIIQLDLPINGALDDIRVNPSDVISQAIGSALKAGAKTYLAAAIFPYGTFLVVAESLGKEVMKVDIDPIIFEPGSIVLNEKSKKYLEKISTILKQRPELNLRVCGKATLKDQGDPIIPDEILLTLAQNRAKVVDDFLINEYGLKNNRLISCKAKLQLKNKKANPRVELQF